MKEKVNSPSHYHKESGIEVIDAIESWLADGGVGFMIGNIIQSMFGKAFNWPLGAAISVMVMLTITAMVCVFLWGTHQFRRRVA